jgi:hypothetical protein
MANCCHSNASEHYANMASLAKQAAETVKPLGRIPCTDMTCKKEHEWLHVGPTAADYHPRTVSQP